MSLADRRRRADRDLIPRAPWSDITYARLALADVPQLTAAQTWAERHLIRLELAERIHCRRPERLIATPVGVVTEVGWLRRRVLALDQHWEHIQ